MERVTYFTAGSVATAQELAEIAKINTASAKPFEVLVVNGSESSDYGYGERETDYVAGTVPEPYASEDPAYPVFDPDSPPTGDNIPANQVVISDGDELTLESSAGTVTVAISEGAATYTFVAP